MSKQDNTLEVWLDDDLGSASRVGTLAHDRGQIRFHCECASLGGARRKANFTEADGSL